MCLHVSLSCSAAQSLPCIFIICLFVYLSLSHSTSQFSSLDLRILGRRDTLTWYDGALLGYVCRYVYLGNVADIHYVAAMQPRLRSVTRYEAYVRRKESRCRHACAVTSIGADTPARL